MRRDKLRAAILDKNKRSQGDAAGAAATAGGGDTASAKGNGGVAGNEDESGPEGGSVGDSVGVGSVEESVDSSQDGGRAIKKLKLNNGSCSPKTSLIGDDSEISDDCYDDDEVGNFNLSNFSLLGVTSSVKKLTSQSTNDDDNDDDLSSGWLNTDIMTGTKLWGSKSIDKTSKTSLQSSAPVKTSSPSVKTSTISTATLSGTLNNTFNSKTKPSGTSNKVGKLLLRKAPAELASKFKTSPGAKKNVAGAGLVGNSAGIHGVKKVAAGIASVSASITGVKRTAAAAGIVNDGASTVGVKKAVSSVVSPAPDSTSTVLSTSGRRIKKPQKLLEGAAFEDETATTSSNRKVASQKARQQHLFISNKPAPTAAGVVVSPSAATKVFKLTTNSAVASAAALSARSKQGIVSTAGILTANPGKIITVATSALSPRTKQQLLALKKHQKQLPGTTAVAPQRLLLSSLPQPQQTALLIPIVATASNQQQPKLYQVVSSSVTTNDVSNKTVTASNNYRLLPSTTSASDASHELK